MPDMSEWLERGLDLLKRLLSLFLEALVGPMAHSSKMERFTKRARRVLGLSQRAAERLQHGKIGTEHVLLALIQEREGIAGKALADLKLDEARTETLLIEMTQTGKRKIGIPLELASDSKRFLEHAVDEARRMGHYYIGTEHLLLGLIRLEDSTASAILRECGITAQDVRQTTQRMIKEQAQGQE